MTLTEGPTRRRKSRSPSPYATTSDEKKVNDEENLNPHEPPHIRAFLRSRLTPKGKNLYFVIKLETIPETTDLSVAHSSKPPSVKPAKDAIEDMDYPIQASDASSVKSENEQVQGSANRSFQPSGTSSIKSEDMNVSKNIDDSLQDLSWILRMPGLFPVDDQENEASSPPRWDDLVSTSHTPVKQLSIGPPVNWGLLFREKPLIPRPPSVFTDYDTKTTNDLTVSKLEMLCRSRFCPPQEKSVQPSLSIRPQAFLPKDTERLTTELHQQKSLAMGSEVYTDELSSPPPRPSRIPPAPPRPDKRQPDPVASPPPRPPLPHWKPQDPDKRLSIQIDTPLQKFQRHPEMPSEPEKRQSDSRGSKRPITQRIFRGGKKLVDDALRLARSSLRKDSAYSFASNQTGADHTQISLEPIKATPRAPPLSPSQSNLFSSSSYKKARDKGDRSTPASRNNETGTNSTTPSLASKDSTLVSKATSSKWKVKWPRILSPKHKAQGDMNDSEVSRYFPSIEDNYRLPELDFRSRTLLPFQCTMCFEQSNNKAEWIQHEQRHKEDDEETSEWYWRCGICDNILLSWDDRQNHIADEHFEIGHTLSSWNSSTSPYPWNKLSSKPVSGFPDWDMSILRSMQPTILDDIYRKAEPRNACGVCDLAFPASSELDQHMKQNHVSWSCPTTTRKRKAAFFFEMCRDGCKNQFHSCRCCDMSFCSDSADWKQRKQHFEKEHRFLKCDHDQFFEHAQFCHHLASSHHVEIDFLDMTDQCRQKEYASS